MSRRKLQLRRYDLNGQARLPSVKPGITDFFVQDGNSLFTDQDGVEHVRLLVDGHYESRPLRSRWFQNWLTLHLYELEGEAPPPGRLNAIRNLLCAVAARDHEVLENRSKWLENPGELWIDLCDRLWRAIRVTPRGWQIVSDPPRMFRRFLHQQPLPEPEPGDIGDLVRFLPPLSDADGLLTLVWMITALLPIPRPILVLVGPQGSGKTTMSMWLRRLIDPSRIELLGRDARSDLPLIFNHHAVPVFDNIDELTTQEADLFCQAVTGRGIARRRLYTDADEMILAFRRAIVINALRLPSNRADWLDRALVVELERLPAQKRLALQSLEAAYTAAQPKLLGGLLTALSRALALLPKVDGAELGRMADFHRLGRAVALAIDQDPKRFDDALAAAQRRQKHGALESPLAAAVVLFAQGVGDWKGEASELFRHLCMTARANQIRQRADHWPETPTALGRRLDSLAEALAEHGVEVMRLPRGKKRLIGIKFSAKLVQGEEDELREKREQPIRPLHKIDAGSGIGRKENSQALIAGAPVREFGDGDGFTQRTLSDGSAFYVGRIPENLVWSDATFEAAWRLHPVEKHRIKMIGREVDTPRWQQAYGADYEYTGRMNRALPVPALLEPLLAWSRETVDERLNGILLNWYDGPDHYIGPHHDSTKGMFEGAAIVTISFGETRIFQLSRGQGPTAEELEFAAPAGTVFVMPYETNLAWKHAVPKSKKYRGRRISVTIRAFSTGVIETH